MDAEARRQQHIERTKMREEIERNTRLQERERFKAITGVYPYTPEWRFFNEGRLEE